MEKFYKNYGMCDSALLLGPKFKKTLLSTDLTGCISIDTGSKLLLISSSDGYLLYFCIKSSKNLVLVSNRFRR